MSVVNLEGFLQIDYDIKEVGGLQYVPNCTTLQDALEANGGLEVLDLRGFDPSHLTSIANMFYLNHRIRTILVDANWEIPALLSTQPVFVACSNLVGGAGTTYADTRTKGAMLRIDGGPESETPGYCTVG